MNIADQIKNLYDSQLYDDVKSLVIRMLYFFFSDFHLLSPSFNSSLVVNSTDTATVTLSLSDSH